MCELTACHCLLLFQIFWQSKAALCFRTRRSCLSAAIQACSTPQWSNPCPRHPTTPISTTIPSTAQKSGVPRPPCWNWGKARWKGALRQRSRSQPPLFPLCIKDPDMLPIQAGSKEKNCVLCVGTKPRGTTITLSHVKDAKVKNSNCYVRLRWAHGITNVASDFFF